MSRKPSIVTGARSSAMTKMVVLSWLIAAPSRTCRPRADVLRTDVRSSKEPLVIRVRD
jgi:hypothetical protein